MSLFTPPPDVPNLVNKSWLDRPAEVRTADATIAREPPGFTVKPEAPPPSIPAKPSNRPIPEAVQKAMESVLPVFAGQPPAPSDQPPPSPEQMQKDRQNYINFLQKSGINSVDERSWTENNGTLAVIEKVKGADGVNGYYALTALHVVKAPSDAAATIDQGQSVRTPGGDIVPLRVVGAVEDPGVKPDPKGRDMAVVYFESKEDIPTAKRKTPQNGTDVYISGFPKNLTQTGSNGVTFGNDFTADPDVSVNAPQITKESGATTIFPTNYFAQKVTDRAQITNQTNLGQNSRIILNDANTHLGHSGSPVFNENGAITGVFNAANPDQNGKSFRGPGIGEASPLDPKTNERVNTMIQQDIQKNNLKKTASSDPIMDTTQVKSWQAGRRAELENIAIKTPALENSGAARPG
jgi:hypothetical protein